jgi:lysyl-tRNA synthetase class 2
MSWLPSAPIKHLHVRAELLKKIRDFFYARGVLEVETPLLCSASVTDPHILSIEVKPHHYLQTSPEYAMKRLLAAGSGCIYQITKAFRQDEAGHLHNPEFTLLEWYRVGFDHHELMQEMDELLQLILNCEKADKKTYQELFLTHVQLNPHQANLRELQNAAAAHHINVQTEIHDRDTWLQLLMSHCIEKKLGTNRPCFVYDFPASQAALARIQSGDPAVASRFEVYVDGMELANGFHELQDATEQRIRFEKNLQQRKILNQPAMPIDEFFLSALQHGLPNCAGVALGIDRLTMLAANTTHIADVMSFDFARV